MKLKTLLIMAVSALALEFTMPADANLQSEMNNWFGGYSNSAPASAYQSQAGGFYSGGNYSVRVPIRDVGGFVSVRTPSFSGGCGGIDLDLGGFNLINKDAIVQQLRAIGQNAKALAFSMAIGYVSSLLSAKMDTIKGWADKLNGMQMNSCQAAENLMALGANAVFNTQMTKDQVVCMEEKISSGGMSPDDARTACTSGGGGSDRLTTNAGIGNVGPFTQGNVAWFAMMHSNWLQNDLSMAELLMSLTGTILVTPNTAVPGNQNASSVRPIPGMGVVGEAPNAAGQTSFAVTVAIDKLVFGDLQSNVNSDLYMYQCDSADRTSSPLSCTKLANNGTAIKVDWTTMPSIKKQVKTIVQNIYNNIYSRTSPPGANDLAFIESTAAPIYRYILTSASAFRRTDPASDFMLDKYIDAIAKNIVATNLASMMEVIKVTLAKPDLSAASDSMKKDYLLRVVAVQGEVNKVREQSLKEEDAILEMEERSQQYERVIISRMSASMLNSAAFTAH